MTAWALRDALREACKVYAEQNAIFQELSDSLKGTHNITNWRADVVAWERDPFNCDDPYVTVSQGALFNLERR